MVDLILKVTKVGARKNSRKKKKEAEDKAKAEKAQAATGIAPPPPPPGGIVPPAQSTAAAAKPKGGAQGLLAEIRAGKKLKKRKVKKKELSAEELLAQQKEQLQTFIKYRAGLPMGLGAIGFKRMVSTDPENAMKYFIKEAKIKGGGVTFELAQSFLSLLNNDSDFKGIRKIF